MANNQWELVADHTSKLGEGPVWDAHNERLLWLDILQKEIHHFYTKTGVHKTFRLDQMPGAIVLTKEGGIIGALQHGFARIDLEKETVTPITDPEAAITENRFNDGKCDPDGRFWAGTMALSEAHGAGTLYTLERDLSVTEKIKGVTISNGLSWSPDHKTVYYIDTPTCEIVAYDYNRVDGSIRNKRTVIRVLSEDGYPDGMTIDTEGMLWVAHWAGWQVIRYDPYSGNILTRIKLPVANVTCCTFGGAGLDDLYITTARKDISEEDVKKQPLAGSLFVVRNCGYKGFLPFQFGG